MIRLRSGAHPIVSIGSLGQRGLAILERQPRAVEVNVGSGQPRAVEVNVSSG